MPQNRCRVCQSRLAKIPLLQYYNMPRAAQYLPDSRSLKNDKGINLRISQCLSCGLIQLTNSPVPYYKEVIRAASISPEMKNLRLKQFAAFAKKYSLINKKGIEIGCGQGDYLSLIKQSGIKTYGLEASQKSVNICKKNNLFVTKGFVDDESYKIKNAPFDVFFLLNFLEHLPDPNSTLRGIYNNLSDDALGLVEVPNFDMIVRKKIFSEFISDHLFYFTQETLSSTLAINGFVILEKQEIMHDYVISFVVKKRAPLDLSDFDRHQSKVFNEVKKFLNRFNNKKVAIWGAGHQALTIISMLNLSKKVKYVVDSAPFKQGKFTPAIHIPIVSPEWLNSNPVDAIIIMAAGYSDEVLKIVKQQFDKKIKTAVLRDYGLEII